MTTNGDSLLNVPEASDYLTIPIHTLNYWRSHDQGPAWIKLGRNVRYRVSDLEAWISENTRTPAVSIG